MINNEDQLLGKLLANQENLHADVIEIKKDVKALNEFRWRWTGKLTAYTGIIAAIVTGVIEFFLYQK